jgi:hypothetical protein
MGPTVGPTTGENRMAEPSCSNRPDYCHQLREQRVTSVPVVPGAIQSAFSSAALHGKQRSGREAPVRWKQRFADLPLSAPAHRGSPAVSLANARLN